MRALRLTPIFVSWVLLWSTHVWGQTKYISAAAAPPPVFAHLTAADGLPQSTVYAVLQDAEGLVWLGTEDGLVRYDGHTLYRYGFRRGVPGSLPGNFIQAIVEDARHDLWIALADAGVARWSRGTDRFTVWRHHSNGPDSLGSDDVKALVIDPQGLIWIGTGDAGIDVLDPATGHIDHLRHDANPDSVADDRITALTRGSSGSIWVGTDRGLDIVTSDSHTFRHCSPGQLSGATSSAEGVLSIYVDAGGTVWEGAANSGLIRRDASGRITGHFRHNPQEQATLANDSVHAVLKDVEGHVWIGTESGLDILDLASERFTHYQHDDRDPGSLTDSSIVSLYQDGTGLLWVGTRSGGVNHWSPHSWNFGSTRPAWLNGTMVSGFADADNDRVWIGSMGGGLVRFDPTTGQHEDIDRIVHKPNVLGDSRVMALELDASNTLWIGTMSAGLSSLTPDGHIRSFGVGPGVADRISAPGIMALYAGRDGRLWIGTHGGGANVLDPRTGAVVQLPFENATSGAVSSRNVTGFAEELSGHVWIATDGGGLDMADSAGRVIQVFRHSDDDPKSLPSNSVYGITIDMRGRVWVATDKGLAQVIGSNARPDKIRFQNLGRAEGLADDTVYGSLVDAAGRLWISGNSGLTRYDPDGHTFRSYHVQHGLQGEEFDLGALRRLHDGRLAFGGPGGFNIFDPESIADSNAAPRVALMRVDVLGMPLSSEKPYWLLDDINVSSNAQIITLEFAALDFTAPAHNRLSYRLPKLSDRWINLGTEHDLTLTNLGAGDHILEVRAASADSEWANTPLRLTIHKARSPWESGPALAGYFAVAVALCGYALYVRRQRVAQAERVERLAFFDALTGLPNRQRCLDYAAHLIETAKDAREAVSFIYLDLDGFKRINDTFGHTVGDSVLQVVAERLNQAVSAPPFRPGQVLLSRFGGDEFVLLVRHPPTTDAGEQVAKSCHRSLALPINHEGLEFLSIPSVGIATFPEHGVDAETVLKHADTAMYHIKSAGTGGVSRYSPSMSSRLRKHLQLETRLRRSLQLETLHLNLQPKFRLTDQCLLGAEVLARWTDEQLGEVPPSEFIAVAEESSLIIELGEWVIRAACRQLRNWRDQDISLPLAVNISAKELLHGDPVRVLEQEARSCGVPASLIEIEITESLLVRESGVVRNALDRLRGLGCMISLDDFGTGYSSLAYITRFPPDKIKIDKAFVRHVDESMADSAIAGAILALGNSLRALVIAEGIERRGQLEWLRDRGCHEGQGFLLSRPLTPTQLTEQFLRRHTVASGFRAVG